MRRKNDGGRAIIDRLGCLYREQVTAERHSDLVDGAHGELLQLYAIDTPL